MTSFTLKAAKDPRADYIEQAARFKKWCRHALSFWAETAADPRGGYAELLNMDGEADFNHLRRVRVQARQAFVYAHAAHLGWFEGAREACDQAWDFLIGPGFAGGEFNALNEQTPLGAKGCAHLIKGDGQPHDDMRDLYAQAFVILAGAWRYRAFGDQEALNIAKETLGFIDQYLSADNGGWYEALPEPKSTVRRQNPHMHLFEAVLALYEATQDKLYLGYADRLFGLFKTVFFHSPTGGVLEFFTPDWQPYQGPESAGGGPFEPGHMMEWCWLLRRYEKVSGADVEAYARALFEGGLKIGWNAKLKLICNSVHVDGSPANSNLRSWAQTELIKASVAQAEAGDMDSLIYASAAIKSLFETYLDVPVWGGWADEIDASGQVICATMPTSTFYHYICAASEVDSLAQKYK